MPMAIRRTEKLKTKVMLNPTLSPEDGGRIKINPVSKLKQIRGRTIVAVAVSQRLDKTILDDKGNGKKCRSLFNPQTRPDTR